MSLRVRRLENERMMLDKAFGRHPQIRVRPIIGDPPETYEVTFLVKGLERRPTGALVVRMTHQIEVYLPADYPRLPAVCRMLTPVFHPNIDISTVCTSDFHSAQETLVDLIVRIGQMIAFQKYNVKSPVNAEAARWCEQNLSRLPVDPSDLHPLERSA